MGWANYCSRSCYGSFTGGAKRYNWKIDGDMKCRACGNTFHQKPYATLSGKGRSYCSSACREQHTQVEKHCVKCKKPFKVWKSKIRSVTTCLDCRVPVKNFLLSRNGPNRVCIECHTFFYVKPSEIAKVYRNGASRKSGKFCSMKCKAKWMSANSNPSYTGRGAAGKRPDLDNRYFRSMWEANWARYLNWMKSRGEVKAWQYEVDTFEFLGIKRGSRFYTPDFKVFENNGCIVYHEVKGWMDPQSATKLKRMASYFPEVKIVLIQRNEYYAVKNGLSRIIPNWEYYQHEGITR